MDSAGGAEAPKAPPLNPPLLSDIWLYVKFHLPMCLAQGLKTVTPMRLESETLDLETRTLPLSQHVLCCSPRELSLMPIHIRSYIETCQPCCVVRI